MTTRIDHASGATGVGGGAQTGHCKEGLEQACSRSGRCMFPDASPWGKPCTHPRRGARRPEVEAIVGPATSFYSSVDAISDLEEVRREVFGNIGDGPNVYEDYDRCCELAGKMRRAIAALTPDPIAAAERAVLDKIVLIGSDELASFLPVSHMPLIDALYVLEDRLRAARDGREG